MSITVKIIIAYFGGIVTGVLLLLGWMAACMDGSRQKRNRIDLMLSEYDGKDEGNGTMDIQEQSHD